MTSLAELEAMAVSNPILAARLAQQILAEEAEAEGGSEYIPHEPFPKQAKFTDLDCLEALYGGAAGGGKSDALLMAALRFAHVPEYAGILFRRTYTELALPDAIMARSHEWLSSTRAHWNGLDKRWAFPTAGAPATLSFGYMDAPNDHMRYQGAAFQFCVARGTKILLADGSYKAVEAVTEQDVVATLLGPRRVSRTHRPKLADCVRVSHAGGSIVVSRSHRFLSEQAWAVPSERLPSRSNEPSSTREALPASFPERDMLCASRPSGRLPVPALGGQTQLGNLHQASGAFGAGAQTDSEVSVDAPPGAQRPASLSGRLVLFERALPVALRSSCPECLEHEQAHGCAGREAPGSDCDCRTGRDFCDGQSPPVAAAGQVCTPSRDDAAGRCRTSSRANGLGCTRGHSRPAQYRYSHPYTKHPQTSNEAVRLASATIAPAGEQEVFDLTIEGASHYVASGGFISQNCGFDELTHFRERQFRYMFSRMRRLRGSDVPLRMRGGTNPGGVGHDWVKKRYAIPDTVDFTKVYSSEGRVFIPSSLRDNPHLDQQSYEQALSELDATQLAQLKSGQWVRDTEGLVYREYDSSLVASALPELVPGEAWKRLLACDFGVVDPTAFVELSFNRYVREVYVTRSEQWANISPGEAAEFAVQWGKDCGGYEQVIGDVGGLGKAFQQEWMTRFKLPMTPADKTSKLGFVKLMNGDMRAKKLRFLEGPNMDLCENLGALSWSDERAVSENPDQPNHLTDALLYGWRASRHFAAKDSPNLPAYGSDDWVKAQTDKEREQAFASTLKRVNLSARNMTERELIQKIARM